jgi:hypothetical protein
MKCEKPCDDRQDFYLESTTEFEEEIKELPPVIPTHETCKDCRHYYVDEDGYGYHCERVDYTRFSVYADFYCACFKKRGE